jgi:hypothetical protein
MLKVWGRRRTLQQRKAFREHVMIPFDDCAGDWIINAVPHGEERASCARLEP